MLVQEIALIAGALSSLIALTSCLLVLVSRRQMNQKMDDLRFELQVHMSANHEMAKHLRVLQRSSNAAAEFSEEKAAEARRSIEDRALKSTRFEEDDFSFTDRFELSEGRNTSRATASGKQRSGMSLAEKLGLSESEADIMSHLSPQNQSTKNQRSNNQKSRRVSETI